MLIICSIIDVIRMRIGILLDYTINVSLRTFSYVTTLLLSRVPTSTFFNKNKCNTRLLQQMLKIHIINLIK